jgi:RND family efflux transporter MFP subunit
VEALLYAGLINAAWTVVLALAAAIGGRVWRHRPAVGHTLWLLVLLKLVTPSLLRVAPPVANVPNRDVSAGLEVAAAPHQTDRPVPAVLPVVAPAPRDSEGVASRSLPPADTARRGSVEIPNERSRSSAEWNPDTWGMLRRMAVPGAALLWLLGAIACWSVMGLQSARFRRLIRSARPAPAELRQQMERVAGRLGLRSVPDAYVLPCRLSPMVWVPLFGAPRLVLPEELWGRFEPGQQEAVLAHELAHLRRGDHWVRRLEALACSLYWWDPVAWWARREVERAEERCCDAWVLWALPAAAGAYAEALVVTTVYLSGLRQPLPLGASGVERLNPLKGRLQMILSEPTTVSIRRTAPRALLILGALSLPFLPALASGARPSAAAPVAAAQARPGDQPAEATTKPTQAVPKPSAPTPPPGQPDRSAVAAGQPLEVRVMRPVVREVSDSQQFVGHIVPAREVALKARVSGTLVEVDCRPGQAVKQGDRLFKIDPRPYKSAFDKASAELARARAKQMKWQRVLTSTKNHAEKNVVSQTEVALAESDLLEAEAAVAVAQASLDAAKFDLDFTEVRAPFDGSVSGPMLGTGNIAVADTTLLATIFSTDRMYVTFRVPDYFMQYLDRLKHDGKIAGNGWAGSSATVILSDGKEFPHRGKIDSVEARIDPVTGTTSWRAELTNPDGLLRPGMSVTVRLATSAPYRATLVPEQAVWSKRNVAFVFIATDQGTIHERQVKIKKFFDEMRAVEGVNADEWVVINHVVKIKEGEKVVLEKVPPPQ